MSLMLIAAVVGVLAPAGRDELQNLLQNVVEWPHKGEKVDDRSI